MRAKALKYTIAVIVILGLAWNSVYFRKLDEVKAAAASGRFNAAAYARSFWNKQLLPNLHRAVELETLAPMLATNPEQAFNSYSHALGIGNIRYFMVKGQGRVTGVNENDVALLTDSSRLPVRLATEYVFGNAVRDALGLIDINTFNNTIHFNNVSAEVNSIIRKEVLPPFIRTVKKGDTVQFTGAIELNRAHLRTDSLEVIPVALKIVP